MMPKKNQKTVETQGSGRDGPYRSGEVLLELCNEHLSSSLSLSVLAKEPRHPKRGGGVVVYFDSCLFLFLLSCCMYPESEWGVECDLFFFCDSLIFLDLEPCPISDTFMKILFFFCPISVLRNFLGIWAEPFMPFVWGLRYWQL